MSDLISRKAVINALNCDIAITGSENAKAAKEMLQTFIDRINALPDADFKYDEWCHDCKEYDYDRGCCSRWNRVIKEALTDLESKIIYCRDCKNHIDRSWCSAAYHNTGDNEYCASVFGAKRRGNQEEAVTGYE